MIDRALQDSSPRTKWFVFIESYTYLVWQNVLQYFSLFDAEQPYYIGTPTCIGPVIFAHGGSGFVLSSRAVAKVVRHWRDNLAQFDQYTETE